MRKSLKNMQDALYVVRPFEIQPPNKIQEKASCAWCG
jgi:hypothetical protein